MTGLEVCPACTSQAGPVDWKETLAICRTPNHPHLRIQDMCRNIHTQAQTGALHVTSQQALILVR